MKMFLYLVQLILLIEIVKSNNETKKSLSLTVTSFDCKFNKSLIETVRDTYSKNCIEYSHGITKYKSILTYNKYLYVVFKNYCQCKDISITNGDCKYDIRCQKTFDNFDLGIKTNKKNDIKRINKNYLRDINVISKKVNGYTLNENGDIFDTKYLGFKTSTIGDATCILLGININTRCKYTYITTIDNYHYHTFDEPCNNCISFTDGHLGCSKFLFCSKTCYKFDHIDSK